MSPFDSVGAIFSCWGQWTPDEESELQLTPHEMIMYHDVSLGSDVRKLEMQHIAATMLHSYANALTPCPCGCRQKGFHPLTLQRGGLRGYYIISPVTGKPRFLHPREAGLLLGLPDSIQYIHPPRASLSLLGLVASPLQALWIYGHLKRNHWLATQTGPCPSVAAWLRAYCQELLTQAAASFGPANAATVSLDLQAFGAPLALDLRHSGTTVHQLLQAERISLAWNESCELWTSDLRLGWNDHLQNHATTLLHSSSSFCALLDFSLCAKSSLPRARFSMWTLESGHHWLCGLLLHLLGINPVDFSDVPMALTLLNVDFMMATFGLKSSGFFVFLKVNRSHT
eukprot:s280_g28.t2